MADAAFVLVILLGFAVCVAVLRAFAAREAREEDHR